MDKAAALIAYCLDIEATGGVDHVALAELVDDVCDDDIERARLVSYFATSQSPYLPKILRELLGTRLDRQRDALEALEDADAVYGVWGQRTAGGWLLAAVGFVVTGLLTGGWSGLALGAGVIGSGGSAVARGNLKARARRARRRVEQTERLLDEMRPER